MVDVYYLSLYKSVYFFSLIRINFKFIDKISELEIAPIIFPNVRINETAFVHEVNNKVLVLSDQSYIGRDIRNRNMKKLSSVVENIVF